MSRSLDASSLHSSTVPLIMRVFFSLSLSRVWGQDLCVDALPRGIGIFVEILEANFMGRGEVA